MIVSLLEDTMVKYLMACAPAYFDLESAAPFIFNHGSYTH